MTTTQTDPIYALATLFVIDTIEDTGRTVPEAERQEYIRRGAVAMQQAIEDVCRDIEAELLEG
jgi:hypothetical protein